MLPYSDLDPARWREYPDIRTDSLWLDAARQKGDGHALTYHGGFIPQLPNQLIRRYTKPGDIVYDPFLGSGTTLIEALNLGRRGIGVELHDPAWSATCDRLSLHADTLVDPPRMVVLRGDSTQQETLQRVRDELRRWDAQHVQLVILHPPYHDIISFSDDPADLSNCKTPREFLAGFARACLMADLLLEPGRHLALVMGDLFWKGAVVPLGFRCMEIINQLGLGQYPAFKAPENGAPGRPGWYKLKSIIIKNIAGNEAKGKDENLWRYRALKSGFSTFKHEYLFVFQKTEGD